MSLILKALAESEPSKIIVNDGATTLTASSLNQQISIMANWLNKQQLSSVALLADNNLLWLIVDLACLKLNLVLIPVPAFFSAEQQKHVLNDSGAELLLTDGTEQTSGIVNFNAKRLKATSVPLPKNCAKITYTSGTTGNPKGVCLSLEQMEAVASSIADVAKEAGVNTHLCLLPLAVLLENIGGIYTPLLAGIKIELRPLSQLGFTNTGLNDINVLIQTLNECQPESFILVPQMLPIFIEIALQSPPPDNLKLIALGGGKTATETLQKAIKLGLPIYEGYGLSECASVVAMNRPSSNRPGSVGKVLPHVQVQIAQDGEISINGNSMLGYLGSSGHDGKITTGDIGHMDKQDYLYIEGRKKNTIITGMGRNVAPEWVESELMASGYFDQVMVYGDEQIGINALLVLNELVEKKLVENDLVGIKTSTDIERELKTTINKVNNKLPDYARIQSFELSLPFTNNELTPNGRLRRQQILNNRASFLRQNELAN